LTMKRVLADGTRVDAVAYAVEPSDEYPEGVKYSFQYCDPEADETLLRYDNGHRYEGHETAHHKHRYDTDAPTEIEYPGTVSEQYREFLSEVGRI